MEDEKLEKALTVTDLAITFGSEVVLNNLNFEISQGESMAIIGPNGAGKTILAKALIGALPYTGEVHWAPGTTIGYVPQKLDIERDIPLSLMDFLRSRNDGFVRADTAKIKECLKLVRLPEELLKKPIGHLSGGQFQRALITFALIGEPKVFIFDEPTAGIDLPGEEEIYATIHRLQDERGFTVILISHDLSLVYRYADKVLCLSRNNTCFGEPEKTLSQENLEKIFGSTRQFYRHVHNHGN